MAKTLLLLFAMSCGIVIAFVDSRPNWDDTGITALAILLASGVFAFCSPSRWWLWAIALGMCIPIHAIARDQNFASLLALVVAFIGAVFGMSTRHGVSSKLKATL